MRSKTVSTRSKSVPVFGFEIPISTIAEAKKPITKTLHRMVDDRPTKTPLKKPPKKVTSK